MDSAFVILWKRQNDGVRHHLFDWGNAKIEKKLEKQ
jgi:hypothetical protein